MPGKTIWASIRQQLFADRAKDWVKTYIEPCQVRVLDQTLIVYTPNAFVSEVIASERPAIRKLLPAEVADVVIRQGSPRDYEAPPGDASDAAARQLPPTPGASSKGSAIAAPDPGRRRPAPDPNSAMLHNVWPRDVRGMPADLLRSSLFTINRYGVGSVRPMRDKELLFSFASFELRATGQETNVFDADVQAQLLHYQRNQVFGTNIWFSLRELCEDLDLAPNGENINRVRESIERLRDTTIELRHRDPTVTRKFRSQLISSFYREEGVGHDKWCVEMSKQLIGLLGPGVQTRYHIETDRKLSSTLAKYLLRFYSSHSVKIHPMKVETMRKLTGTKQPIREFRRKLKAALDELVAVEVIGSWSIEDDKVYIDRNQPARLTTAQ